MSDLDLIYSLSGYPLNHCSQTAPYLANQVPAASSTGVSARTTIYAEVLDDDVDLDPSSVELYLDDTLMWFGSRPLAGFTGKRIDVPKGKGYLITPAEPLETGIHTVRGLASDLANNTMDESYSFTTVLWQLTEQDIQEARVSPGIDLKLGADDHDLVVENYDLALVAGADEVSQHLLVHLRLFYGEWYLDETAGMPYYREFFVAAPNTRVIETLIRQVILGDEDIEAIDEFELEFAGPSRHLDVSFRAVSSVGIVDVSAVVP